MSLTYSVGTILFIYAHQIFAPVLILPCPWSCPLLAEVKEAPSPLDWNTCLPVAMTLTVTVWLVTQLTKIIYKCKFY